jgi:hypothetical protein
MGPCPLVICGRLLHRHVSATDVGAVEAPTIRRGANYANDNDNRSRHCQIGFPGSRRYPAGQVVIRRQPALRKSLLTFPKLVRGRGL